MSSSLPQATYRTKANKITAPTEPVTTKDVQDVKPDIKAPEVKTVAPKVEAVTPKVMAPTAAVRAPAPSDPITNQITTCLDIYKNLLSEKRISNNQAAQAMAHLKKAIDLTIQNPTQSNLIAVWNFFKDNRNGVCKEKVALTGLNTLDLKSRNVATVFYNAFRSRTMGYPNQMRDQEILPTIPCQRLVAFLKTAQ